MLQKAHCKYIFPSVPQLLTAMVAFSWILLHLLLDLAQSCLIHSTHHHQDLPLSCYGFEVKTVS